MTDVSRVVYDAALTRVQKALDDVYYDESNVIASKSDAQIVTLAALGLDEPPTEPPMDRCVKCGAVDRGHEGWGVDHARRCDGFVPRAAAVPPIETPKACPTCDGSGVGNPNARMGTIGYECGVCHGSGIDGGTS